MRYWLAVVSSPATRLPAKLGIVEGSRLVVLGAPADLVLDLPPGVRRGHQARGTADVVLAFFTEVSALDERIDRLAAMIFPAGSLWIAWPKRASGRATDMTDDHVRRTGLPLGLVDNKVCAVDDTWTGLRLVWRRARRAGAPPTPTSGRRTD